MPYLFGELLTPYEIRGGNHLGRAPPGTWVLSFNAPHYPQGEGGTPMSFHKRSLETSREHRLVLGHRLAGGEMGTASKWLTPEAGLSLLCKLSPRDPLYVKFL